MGDNLDRQHRRDDELGSPLIAQGSGDGIALARVQSRRERKLTVRVNGDASGLLDL